MKRICTLLVAAFSVTGMNAQTAVDGAAAGVYEFADGHAGKRGSQDIGAGGESSGEGNVLWKGSQMFDSWSASILIGVGELGAVAVGDIIRVDFTDRTDAFDPVFKKSDWTDLAGMQDRIVRTDTYFEAPVDAESIAEMQASGLRFQGLGFTATSVRLIKATPLIKIPYSEPLRPTSTRHSLSGQKVSSSYKGIVIQDGKKILVQ